MLQKILNGVLISALIATTTLWLNQCHNENREVVKLEKKISQDSLKIEQLHTFYLAWIDSCEAAIIVEDSIIYEEKWYPGETVQVPVAVDSLKVAEIVNEKNKKSDLFIKNYRAKYSFEDLTINYHVKTYGDLLAFGLDSYMLNVETHHNTAVVNKPAPPSDPIIKYRYRRGFYLTAAAGNDLSKWTSWTSIEGGFGYLTRKGVSFGADYQYLSLPLGGDKIFGRFIKIRFGYYFGN